MKPVRLVVVLTMCALTLCMTGCPEDEKEPPAPQVSAKSEAPAQPQEDAAPVQESAETSTDIAVTWKATKGTARQDPIGLLSGTPLVLKDGEIHAVKTVDFKPNAPNASSAKGRYVYKLWLTPVGDGGFGYKGTFSIVWTMTIVHSAAARSEFRSVYTGKAGCFYSPDNKMITDGFAVGTAKTVDTYVAGGSSMPHKTSGTFDWAFASSP